MKAKWRNSMGTLAARLAPIFVLACACGADVTGGEPDTDAGRDTIRLPLVDMGGRTYLGFTGGLYPGADNALAAPHHEAGLERARRIRPLNVKGDPDPNGKYVLVSIGMSNTTQEFCSGSSAPPCAAWSFTGRASADPQVNRTALVIVNGASGGQAASEWTSPMQPNYDRIRAERLAPLGLSERQVQIAWVKVANAGPRTSLPVQDADAYRLVTQMGQIARALKIRYPNVKQVFLSSRIYAGYATTTLNPEPYAYESGFAVKWLVQAQIDQMASGGQARDPRAGDLNYDSVAPWIAWGAYLWGNGLEPRSDGLVWERADLASDGTHPSQSGQAKVGTLLLQFFKTSPYTRCWFLAGQSCR
ncbi:MAG: hypothetical protein HY704_04320 [Gemmatimonadetes bacterium]|nr:hypothetical protein [Gemmatimonadota bacterium]